MGITRCNGYPLGCVRNGYHSVSGVSLSVMGILLGVSVMGIAQCNGYPLGCVRNGYRSV